MDNCLWVLFKKRQDDIHNAFVDAQYVKNICGITSKKLGFNDYPSYLKPIMEDFLSNRRKTQTSTQNTNQQGFRKRHVSIKETMGDIDQNILKYVCKKQNIFTRILTFLNSYFQMHK